MKNDLRFKCPERGSATLSYALVALPILLLIMGGVEVGAMIYREAAISHALKRSILYTEGNTPMWVKAPWIADRAQFRNAVENVAGFFSSESMGQTGSLIKSTNSIINNSPIAVLPPGFCAYLPEWHALACNSHICATKEEQADAILSGGESFVPMCNVTVSPNVDVSVPAKQVLDKLKAGYVVGYCNLAASSSFGTETCQERDPGDNLLKLATKYPTELTAFYDVSIPLIFSKRAKVTVPGYPSLNASGDGCSYTYDWKTRMGPIEHDYDDFNYVNLRDFTLKGSAALVENYIRLTTTNLAQVGDIMLTEPVTLPNQGSFSAYLAFRLTGGPVGGRPADGIVFTIQGDPAQSGGAGEYLGFYGKNPALGVEFDTWDNQEGSRNHIALRSSSGLYLQVEVPFDMTGGGVNHAWIDYDGVNKNFEVRMNQNNTGRPVDALLKTSQNLGWSFSGTSQDLSSLLSGNRYISVSAATGGSYQNHDLLSLYVKQDMFKDHDYTLAGIDVTQPWSPCTLLQCGNHTGLQTRDVWCNRWDADKACVHSGASEPQIKVPDFFCPGNRPASSQSCDIADPWPGEWKPTPLTVCISNRICGSDSGWQWYTYYCSDSNVACCAPPQPAHYQASCNTRVNYYTGSYAYGSWGDCSGPCSTRVGTQIRTESCSTGCCDPATRQATSKSCTVTVCDLPLAPGSPPPSPPAPPGSCYYTLTINRNIGHRGTSEDWSVPPDCVIRALYGGEFREDLGGVWTMPVEVREPYGSECLHPRNVLESKLCLGESFVMDIDDQCTLTTTSGRYCGAFGAWFISPISLLIGVDSLSQVEPQLVDFSLDPGNPKAKSAWYATEKTPLLVYDPKHEGKITGPEQLFGNYTWGGNQGEAWSDGYEALSKLDSNSNKVLEGEELKDLGLWFDRNQNGISESGEVIAASHYGLIAIRLGLPRIEREGRELYIDDGFAIIQKDGSITKGKMVDWYGIVVDETKLSETNSDGLIIRKAEKEPSLDSKTIEELLNKQKLVDGGAASDRLELSKKDIEQQISGKWTWKTKVAIDGDQRTGYLLLKNDEKGGLSGVSLGVIPMESINGIRSWEVAGFAISGAYQVLDDGNVDLRFTVGKVGEKGYTATRATLDVRKKVLMGASETRSDKDDLTVAYAWSAMK